MKNYTPFILCILLVAFLFKACKKEEGVDFSPIPMISVVSVAPTTIQEFTDSIVVTLKFEDGDGDLGFEQPDSMSLKVQDSRLENPDWYFVKPLAPPGEAIPIRGQFVFNLNGTFILGSGDQESATFAIRLRDRAGNWSNEVATPVITIKR